MKTRIPLLDSLRGAAVLLMTGYHFCFDLSLFGAATFNFRAPFWLAYRALVVTLFVGIAGIGFSLTRGWHRARLARLGGCALLVSLGTAFVFPHTWVFFGILHFLFVASLLGPLFARHPRACLPAGVALVLLPYFASVGPSGSPGPLLQLTGFSPVLFPTLDFVPLFPWLGVALLGIFVGSRIQGHSWGRPGPLAFLGRHALLYYMIHQAALLPLAWGIARII